MRCFWTQGPVNSQEHYVVSRSDEIADFIKRVGEGRYIVLFAPRQTGKTTFFRDALAALTEQATDYFPIQLNFDVYKNTSVTDFYVHLYQDICEEIENVFHRRTGALPEALSQFLMGTTLTDHHALRRFFRNLERLLDHQKVVVVIDEFDGIPPACFERFSAYAPPYLHCW